MQSKPKGVSKKPRKPKTKVSNATKTGDSNGMEHPIFAQMRGGIFAPDFVAKMEAAREEINTAYIKNIYNDANRKVLVSNMTQEELEEINDALFRWKINLLENGAYNCKNDKERPLLIIQPHKWAHADDMDYGRGKLLDIDSNQTWTFQDYISKDSRHDEIHIALRTSDIDMEDLKPVKGDISLLKKHINFKIVK